MASCVWRRAEAASKLSDSRHERGEPGWSEACAQMSCPGKLLSYSVGTISTLSLVLSAGQCFSSAYSFIFPLVFLRQGLR